MKMTKIFLTFTLDLLIIKYIEHKKKENDNLHLLRKFSKFFSFLILG